MATIFTRIIDGEIPGTFVLRDDRCVVFLSINPLAHGHALVVPIEEIDHWVDVPADLHAHLFEIARVVGQAQQAAFSPTRVGLIVAGFEVPHAHIHVVPIDRESQLSFSNAEASVERDELERAAGALRSALNDAGHGDSVVGLPS
ncbi:MAG: HIT family protein [Ilumatobacter sp.]|nr:HIT family protein [Ilumatobacter sp.]